MSNDSQRYEFSGIESMLGTANDPTKLPRADEKPVFTTSKAGDADYTIGDGRGGRAKAERLDDVAKCVYNPETGHVFGVVSDDYEIINPPEFIGPLAHELKERNLNDVTGSFTMYDNGARGYAEVLTDGYTIWPEDRDDSQEPVRSGITFRWSHDGGISVRASGFAQDGICKNTMRQVSDSVYVKHAGDVNARVDWEAEWASVLDSLGAFSETLQTVIGDALGFELFDLNEDPFSDEWLTHTDTLQMHDPHDPGANERITPVGPLTPDDVLGLQGFYSYLGFPTYLADEATMRLLWRLSQRDDPTTVNAWDAYSALTYALTHRARFDTGSSSDDSYHRTASDVLTNPAKALQDAHAGLAGEMQPDVDDEDAYADAMLTVENNVGDAARTFNERERELRATFGGSDDA